jgi:ABC-type sugar transport system substrate-binding protein
MEIRRSFELASRRLPLDMIYYDNGGDVGKALANAADAVSRKVDLLIEYNSDAVANAEIGRQLKAAGIPVLAINHAIPGAPLYTADHLAAGRIAGQTLGQFAPRSCWLPQPPTRSTGLQDDPRILPFDGTQYLYFPR